MSLNLVSITGADRLLILAAEPIQGLPPEINGVPVELRVSNTVATTH